MIIFRGGYSSRSINYNALLENATYNIESDTITLGTPEREGYKFTGWTGSNGDTPQLNVTIPKGSIGDLTFNANWELDGIAGPVLSGYIREDNGKPRLTWTAVSDTIKYEMFRSEDNGITWNQVYETEDLSYTNTGAKAGVAYKYKVRAIISDTEEESLFSNIVTLTPTMVTPVLNGELNEDYNPHLYWDDYYVDYYEVYRSTDQKTWTKMWDTKETQGKSYTNTDVTEGTTYYYKIKTIQGNEESEWSNIVSLKVPTLISYAAIYNEEVLVLGKAPFNDIPQTFTYELEKEEIVGSLTKSWKHIENTSKQLWSYYNSDIKLVCILQKISPKNMDYWFQSCNESVTFVGLEKIDTSHCISARYMFANIGCYGGPGAANLRHSHSLEVNISGLENLDVSNIQDMSFMFYKVGYSYAQKIYIKGIDYWNVSNVKNMQYMFYNVGSIAAEYIDLGNIAQWNVSNVQYMQYMFDEVGYSSACDQNGHETHDMNFTLDLSNWNCSSVRNYFRFSENTDIITPTWVN